MKNTFNETQKEILKKCWEDGTLITIEGINDRGDKFVTTGRITTTDNGEPGIEDDAIYLEFGVTKERPAGKQTAYFAPYRLNIETQGYFPCDFTIKRLFAGDEEIYWVENEDEIDEIAEENRRTIPEPLLRDGDVVSKAMLKMIGKPIQIDGDCCVLLGVERNGCFQVRKGPLVGGLHVNDCSILYTEDNNGEKIKLASNMSGYYNFEYLDKDDIENE